MLLAIILAWVAYQLKAPWWIFVILAMHCSWSMYRRWKIDDKLEDCIAAIEKYLKEDQDGES